ncbi:MAG: DUF177 domain-containing protein [Lachnospiraceae bacterium]|nr:DUF177 domain-containing protein [Lachnospiraceae bacterium]
MIIDLSEIYSQTGSKRSVEVYTEMHSFKTKAASYEIVDAPPFTLNVSNVLGKTLTLEAHTVFTLIAPCDRCLCDVKVEVPVDIEKSIPFAKEEQDPDEEIDCYLSDKKLDMDSLLCTELSFNFPMIVLCKDDCKGLCPDCGANLNEGTCGCADGKLDWRMSAILDLYNKSKEV